MKPHFKRAIIIFLLYIVSALFLNLCYDYIYDRERNKMIQAYSLEYELGPQIVELYKLIAEAATNSEMDEVLIEEKIPLALKNFSVYADKFDEIDYLRTDADLYIGILERKLNGMIHYYTSYKNAYSLYKEDFLENNLDIYQWALARQYYSNIVNLQEYFSDEDEFAKKYPWYDEYYMHILLAKYGQADETWEEYRQKHNAEVLDEMVIAEQKNVVFYEIYNAWAAEFIELHTEEEQKKYLKSENTKQMLDACAESIQADIDSLVYWDENTDIKVYIIHEYGSFFDEHMKHFQRHYEN